MVSNLTKSPKRTGRPLSKVFCKDTAHVVTRGGLLQPDLQRLMNPDSSRKMVQANFDLDYASVPRPCTIRCKSISPRKIAKKAEPIFP